MKKTLRFFMLTLFLAAVGGGNAQTLSLTFPDENSDNNKVSGYEKTWTATIGENSWSIENFNNNSWNNSWTYIKCGRKSYDSVASITTGPVETAIEKVVVTIDAITASYVNSISMTVASDEGFETVVETIAAETFEKGDMTFTVNTPTKNCYYKLTFDCAKASSNGVIQISTVNYYAEGESDDGDDTVTTTGSGTEDDPYTASDALAIINAGTYTSSSVYVTGTVSQIDEIDTGSYGNATYYISDDGSTTSQLEVYRGYYLGNAKFTSTDQLSVGDKVVIYGVLTMYYSTPEVTTGSYIVSLNGETAPEATEMTIAQAQAADEGTNCKVTGQVYALTTRGLLLGDETGYIYYYNTSIGDYAIGDNLTIEGAVSLYGGLNQFTSTATITNNGSGEVTYPEATTMDGSAFDAYITTPEIKYVTFEGTLNISGNYYNVTVENAETAVGSIAYPTSDIAKSLTEGEKLVFTGFTLYLSGSVYVNVALTEAAVSTGIENVTAVDAASDGAVYNLAGQRVDESYKGVVIQNGKKVLRK